MKKAGTAIIAIVTLVFLGFTGGVYFGRNGNSQPVETAAATAPEAAATYDTQATALPSSRLNINTATAQQLDELPGIGPVIAQRIVDYRQENGPFTALADLGNVEGIGPERLMDILEWITLED